MQNGTVSDCDEIEISNDSESEKPEETKKRSKGLFDHNTAGFDVFSLAPVLLTALTDGNFVRPSRTQTATLPHSLRGASLICQAESGTGKTLVFVLTVLHRLAAVPPAGNKPLALVIAHTRELAFQLATDFRQLAFQLSDVQISLYTGGVPLQEHINELTTVGANTRLVAVGTPGRLLELVSKEKLDPTSVAVLVLDECDKALCKQDMRTDIRAVVAKVPKHRQTLLFSATFSADALAVCRVFAVNALELFVDGPDTDLVRCAALGQFFVRLSEAGKFAKLLDLLAEVRFNQCVVFLDSIERAEKLTHMLKIKESVDVAVSHGKLSQKERLDVYSRFRSNKLRVLVATDLLGRGVDFLGISFVVNYDMPKDSLPNKDFATESDSVKYFRSSYCERACDTYLHRVGRAARFGRKGFAVSFVSSPEDEEVLALIRETHKVKIEEFPEDFDHEKFTGTVFD